MAPVVANLLARSDTNDWRKPGTPQETLILESWSEGVMLGSLMIMAGITVANMRRRVWLHKLIFLELILALTHGTFCFMDFNGYGWYLSTTATFLYISYWLHNVIAWMKIKPFLTRRWSNIFIGTVILVIPVYIFEIFNNFRFFNNIDNLYQRVRPYEPLFRDPWWVLTTVWLVKVIKTEYDIPFTVLFRRGPRFGMMLVSMVLSIAFILTDVFETVLPFAPGKGQATGVNPYWKFALIFKCFCDTIILDDFKTALEKLRRGVFETYETVRYDDGEDTANSRERRGGVDQGGGRRHRFRTMSIPVGPTQTASFLRSSSKHSAHRNASRTKGEAKHLESTERSQTSRPSNEDDPKEPIDLEHLRGNRLGHAKEAVGKVGQKLSHLPRLGAVGGPFRKNSSNFSGQTLRDSPSSSEMQYSPISRNRTVQMEEKQIAGRATRSVPDPHHIPTDEELEEDPTGRKHFEERRRVQISREEGNVPDPVLEETSSNVGWDAHPGQPWGMNEVEDGDEPWGVNQVARANGRVRDPAQTRSLIEEDDETGEDGDPKIDYRDAL